MHLFKHMEMVLMLAFGTICAVALRPATAPYRALNTAQATAAAFSAEADAAMPVVHVIGRRLTAAEKRGNDTRAGN